MSTKKRISEDLFRRYYLDSSGKWDPFKSELRRMFIKGAMMANQRATGFMDGNSKLYKDCEKLTRVMFTYKSQAVRQRL